MLASRAWLSTLFFHKWWGNNGVQALRHVALDAVIFVAMAIFVLIFSRTDVTRFTQTWRPLSLVPGSGREGSAVSGSTFPGTPQRQYAGPRLFAGGASIANMMSPTYSSDANYGPHSNKWAVCTTIFRPSEAIIRTVALQGWAVVVVGDVSSAPFNFSAPNLVCLDVEQQQPLAKPFTNFIETLPWRHWPEKHWLPVCHCTRRKDDMGL